MTINVLSDADYKLIHLGYISRLSAGDTCAALNQSRIPGDSLLPSVVSYQYIKLKGKGIQQLSPAEVLSFMASAALTTNVVNTLDKPAASSSSTPDLSDVEDFA